MIRPAGSQRRTIVFLTALAILAGACSGSRSVDRTGTAAGGNTSATLNIDTGEQLYGEFCSACHGFDGEGQPNWKIPDENGIRPAPPHNASGHTWHHPDSLLLDIIANGSAFGPSNMPGFGDALTDEEQRTVLAFIKTWWEDDQLEFQEEITSRD